MAYEMPLGGGIHRISSVPDPDGFHEGPLPASKTSLLDVMEDVGTKTIHYIYDFGDNWHHVIKVEKIDDAIPGAEYPRLVRAIGACPPEDIGGFPGYADFLEAIADPAHEAHAEMLEWYGPDFDIEDAGIDRILDKFECLAKKWAPRPRKNPAKGRSSRSTPNPAVPAGCLPLATGLSLMFGVVRFINLAHGDMAVLGAMIALWLVQVAGLGVPWAIAITLPVMGALGWLMQRLIFERALRGGFLIPILTTIGLAAALQNGMFGAFGSDTRSLGAHVGVLSWASWELPGDIFVGQLPEIMFATAMVVLGALHLVLTRTPFGRAVRAIASDPDAAALRGVDAARVHRGGRPSPWRCPGWPASSWRCGRRSRRSRAPCC